MYDLVRGWCGLVRTVLVVTLIAALAAAASFAAEPSKPDAEGIAFFEKKVRPVLSGKPDESPLIQAVHYQHDDLQMPPKQKLPAAAVFSDLEKWIGMGAPSSPLGPAGTTGAAVGGGGGADQAGLAEREV